MNDKSLGWVIFIGSFVGIIIYLWLVFISPWGWLTIQISASFVVVAVLLIVAWIGYTLMTTPTPAPMEDFEFSEEPDEENQA
jgi:predicted DNA-binding transcriptional regulator